MGSTLLLKNPNFYHLSMNELFWSLQRFGIGVQCFSFGIGVQRFGIGVQRFSFEIGVQRFSFEIVLDSKNANGIYIALRNEI